MPQKRKILKVAPFDDIHVIGINTTIRDYKLAWFINKELKTDLSKTTDIEVYTADGDMLGFPFYYFHAGENQNIYNLIGNRSSGALFTSLTTKTDYFLIIRNSLVKEKLSEIIRALKRVPGVHLAFQIDPFKEKSIDLMLEQIELHEFKTMHMQRKRLPKNTTLSD